MAYGVDEKSILFFFENLAKILSSFSDKEYF